MKAATALGMVGWAVAGLAFATGNLEAIQASGLTLVIIAGLQLLCLLTSNKHNE